MRVLVGGALANKPGNGGEAWVRLNWLLGLRALGLEVSFVEQIDSSTLVDARGCGTDFARSINREYFSRVLARFGLSDRASLVCDGGAQTEGLGLRELRDVASDADLLVNISGHLTLPGLVSAVRRKAYVDIDPGFTQFWHTAGLVNLDHHDTFFTVGSNIGDPHCTIPTCGRRWHVIAPPVMLDEWPVAPQPPELTFTTVARWRGTFGRVEFGGRTFGQKAHEFRKFAALPRCARQRCEIALDIDPADEPDRRMLLAAGWTLTDPKTAAGDPDGFRNYVRGSGAELSVAQGLYVETGSGWVSDRTAGYLASGRPALVQDTGFSRRLPVGEGLVAFRTLDEAVRGAGAIAARSSAHAQAARQLAERHFDARVVLPHVLSLAMDRRR